MSDIDLNGGAGMPDRWQRLWAPHRMSYLEGENRPLPGNEIECPFCRIPKLSDSDGLIVARGSEAYVVMNLYPYNAGHLLICANRHVADLTELTDLDRDAFPEIALEVTRRLDGVFGIEMAYIAAWHQAPVRVGRDLLRLHWQITSVRRAPGKLKYLAGSESAMGAFIMDMRPEQSAAQLREVVL